MALLPSPGPDVTPGVGGTKSGGILDTALNILDPAGIRLQAANLFKGGVSSLFDRKKTPGTVVNTSANPVNVLGSDWRVKISLAPASTLFYNDPANQIQQPLQHTNGVLFPYTPQVSIAHNARYQEQALTHSNYKNYFYEGSDVAAITISGDFTVQNVEEGRYLLAAIYFLRSATKMFFGADDLAGNPPPIVYLNGYGELYLPNVSCVITNFSHTMPPDVDYVEIPYTDRDNAGYGQDTQLVRLPTTSQLSVTLQPVYSRNNVHNNLTLTDFSNGKLLSQGRRYSGFL